MISNAAANASHTFTLAASSAGGRCEDTNVTRPLDLGNADAAVVNDASCVLLGGPIAEGWRITLTQQARVKVSATSAAFGPTVAVTSADYEELLNYSILPAPGTATVTVNLPAGEYLVWGGSFDFLNGTVQVGVEVVPPCAPTGTLVFDTVRVGALEASDCRMVNYEPAYGDVWTFTVEEFTTVQLDVASAEFDTWLELYGDRDNFITWNDDNGASSNSRIVYDLQPGAYRVWVTSYGPNETGDYTLSAIEAAGALNLQRAPQEQPWLSSPSGKRERPGARPWPARRTDGTGRR